MIPAPLASDVSTAPEAIRIFESLISSVFEFTVVVVPFTVRFPPIVTVPEEEIFVA